MKVGASQPFPILKLVEGPFHPPRSRLSCLVRIIHTALGRSFSVEAAAAVLQTILLHATVVCSMTNTSDQPGFVGLLGHPGLGFWNRFRRKASAPCRGRAANVPVMPNDSCTSTPPMPASVMSWRTVLLVHRSAHRPTRLEACLMTIIS